MMWMRVAETVDGERIRWMWRETLHSISRATLRCGFADARLYFLLWVGDALLYDPLRPVRKVPRSIGLLIHIGSYR
jgi:hypothetical protein